MSIPPPAPPPRRRFRAAAVRRARRISKRVSISLCAASPAGETRGSNKVDTYRVARANFCHESIMLSSLFWSLLTKYRRVVLPWLCGFTAFITRISGCSRTCYRRDDGCEHVRGMIPRENVNRNGGINFPRARDSVASERDRRARVSRRVKRQSE